MAIGDEAKAQGYPLVPGSGSEGLVKYGAREINRTRDFIAQVKALASAVTTVAKGGTGATTAAAARTNLGINFPLPIANGGTGATTAATARTKLGVQFTGKVTMSTANPSGGSNGDVWFKYT